MYDLSPYSYPGVSKPVSAATLPYLRRVYGMFSVGILSSVVGALLALYAGTPEVFSTPDGAIAVPPAVAFGLQHGIVMMVVYLGAFFAASALRRRPGVNVVALIGFTFVTGLFLAPALFFAQASAAAGGTLDPAPVRDAFLLTAAAFTGLTTYVFATKRDFSFMGAGLSMGLWVLIGASLIGLFVHGAVFHLAIASVGVLLFCGYILYDTSRILHDRDESDPVGAALRLFLDVFNLFLFLLRILSSSRER